ncbi:zinc metalloprotease [Weizmannia acidilactici]|uniref:Zinc metalloprotease n=1 Tax=Weizmannia acidilactici TaxID=2607726 RepID=A0A5J4J1R4_9BACI|nr:RIP metalloprotease RseP [Weizmannia acidilactici]GER65658.1 zinc metalloprotease [Weizmannia acidilactici]GER69012.1 zinc metalloprotease [Weizmannia acidilactici]GER72015.1 zinc metalloprotease [Weizmannia acidilactici]
MTTVIAFILIFSSLVIFHEAGHFFVAKRAGILCREFAIGFGPKILSFKKNETQYTIRLLPIGGYVRMAGEDPDIPELKPGQRIGLLLDDNETVEKIVVNGKDRYTGLRMIETESADLEHALVIKGYEEGDDENLQTFKIKRDAVFVEDRTEMQIAPWDRQFASKSLGKRALTIFAGPFMNFVLAAIVFTMMAIVQGVPVSDPVLGTVVKNSAAAQAGLHKGDTVISIDGAEISTWNDIVEVIQKHPDEEITFTIERGGKTMDIPVTPKSVTVDGKLIGRIGVNSPVDHSPLKVATYGITQTYVWTVEIFKLLGHLITGGFSIDALSGPVGIYKSTETVAKSGLIYLFKWAGLLSINIGIMNLLPLPALDGGRLLFFGIEALRGKPIDRQKEGIVHFIGFALLMLLMIIVTWNDIQRFFL